MNTNVLQELSRHTGLRGLYVQGKSKVTAEMLEVLPSLAQLHTLNIDSNLLTGQIWPLVGKLPELRVLNFYTNSQLTCEGLGELRSCPQLWSLILIGTQVADADLEPLGDLPELNDLRLSSTSISNAGLVHLERCHELRIVDLRKTNVTAAGVAKLQQALSSCLITWDAQAAAALK